MIYTYAHTHTIFLLLITYNADNADTQFSLPLLCAAFAYPKLKPVFIRQYKLPSRFIWYDDIAMDCPYGSTEESASDAAL